MRYLGILLALGGVIAVAYLYMGSTGEDGTGQNKTSQAQQQVQQARDVAKDVEKNLQQQAKDIEKATKQ
jgi:hypothetical protein